MSAGNSRPADFAPRCWWDDGMSWRVGLIDSCGSWPGAIDAAAFAADGERVERRPTVTDPSGHGTRIAQLFGAGDAPFELLLGQVFSSGRPASGRHDRGAVPALDLTQPPDQVQAGTHRAPVQVGHPVIRGLAARADENLAVLPHPALPRALPAARVGLPHATSIAGHPWLLRSSPGAGSPAGRAPGTRLSSGRRALSGTRRHLAPGESGSPLSTGSLRFCQ